MGDDIRSPFMTRFVQTSQILPVHTVGVRVSVLNISWDRECWAVPVH